MKLLFVTDECFAKSGGGTYTRALIQVFYNVVGRDNFYVYFPYKEENSSDFTIPNLMIENCKKPNNLVKFFNMLISKPGNFTKRSRIKILQFIEQKNIDIVVLSRSFYGGICADIKRKYKNVIIITFFHDVIDEVIKERKNKESRLTFLKNYPKLRMFQKNEYMSVQLTDKAIVLNERDYKLFVQDYKRIPDAIIPIFTRDKFKYELLEKVDEKNYSLLFVGSYYWPNIIGIKWFVENVMNNIADGYNLYIVGRNLEKIKSELENDRGNVKVIGTVDDLDEWYYKADIVVGPIFDGSGMKTKTAEALMYGKVYLGAAEALCGFVGVEEYCCNTAEDFLVKIYKFREYIYQNYKFSKHSRQIYLENYSEDVISERIKTILK